MRIVNMPASWVQGTTRPARLPSQSMRATVVLQQYARLIKGYLHGATIPDVKYPYPRWERTLKRLAIRYRKPYVARHISVSWNLMFLPLLVPMHPASACPARVPEELSWKRGRAVCSYASGP